MRAVSRARVIVFAGCGAIALLVVLFAGLLLVARANAIEASGPPIFGRQAWFLNVLKTLADADRLDDPDKVGAILGVKFNKTVVTTSPSHMESFAKSFERNDYTPTTETWFLAGPPGYASIGNFRPNGHDGFVMGVDPLARGSSVNFKYFQSKRFGLPEERLLIAHGDVRDDSQVSILFYGIDKLTCVTLSDIQARFPGIHHMEATDASAEQYLYYPRVREDSGTVLSFTALDGRCVTEASVDEFSNFGKRHERAQFKFFRCLEEAAQEFCNQHPDMAESDDPIRRHDERLRALTSGRNDPRPHDLIETYVRERCVGLNTFYDKEPRTNEEPPGKIEYPRVPWRCSQRH